MNEKKREEKKKDEILQLFHDIMDGNDWGSGCENFSIKLEFRDRFVLSRVYVDRIVRGVPIHTLDKMQGTIVELK